MDEKKLEPLSKKEIDELVDVMVDGLANLIVEEQFDETLSEEEIEKQVDQYFYDIGETMFAWIYFNGFDWEVDHHFGKGFWKRLAKMIPEEPERFDGTNCEYWCDDDATKEEKEHQTELADEYREFWEGFVCWDYIYDEVLKKVLKDWKKRRNDKCVRS